MVKSSLENMLELVHLPLDLAVLNLLTFHMFQLQDVDISFNLLLSDLSGLQGLPALKVSAVDSNLHECRQILVLFL